MFIENLQAFLHQGPITHLSLLDHLPLSFERIENLLKQQKASKSSLSHRFSLVCT